MDNDGFKLKEEDMDKVSGGTWEPSGGEPSFNCAMSYINQYRSTHPESQVNFKRLIEAMTNKEWVVVRGIAYDAYSTAADREFAAKLLSFFGN